MPTNSGATSFQSLPYPELGAPAHPDNVKELADFIDGRVVMRFASSSARDAAITSPAEGQTAWLNDVDQMTTYDGSAWQVIAQPLNLGAWTSYTPTWTSSGTAPAIGNGTLSGKYLKVGRMVHFAAKVLYGSTTTSGTGSFKVGLPVTTSAADLYWSFAGDLLNTGTAQYPITGYAGASSTKAEIVLHTVTGSTVYHGTTATGTTPFTFATGDWITINGTYEAAA